MSALTRPLAQMGNAGERVFKALAAGRAEILAAAVLLSGWALVVYGVATLLARWLPPAGFYAIGAGLFLLSCFGWKMLLTMARVGLYALSQADQK